MSFVLHLSINCYNEAESMKIHKSFDFYHTETAIYSCKRVYLLITKGECSAVFAGFVND